MKMNILLWALIMLPGLTLVSCSKYHEEPSEAEAAQEVKEYPDQESWKSSILITQDGRRVADVWAGYIAVYNRRGKSFLQDSIHVDFFDRSGRHNSVLTARQGVVENQTKNLTATGHVVVVSDSGIVLETEELFWDQQKQKIISQLRVKFTTRTDTLIGDSFISDPDLRHYEIRNARGYSRKVIPLEKK